MEIKQLTSWQGPKQVFKAIRVQCYPNQYPIGHVRYLRSLTNMYGPTTQDAIDEAILKALGDLFSGADLVCNELLLFNEQHESLMMQTRGVADHLIWLHFYDTIGMDQPRREKPVEVQSIKFTLVHWLAQTDERRAFLPDQMLVPVEADLPKVLPTVTPI